MQYRTSLAAALPVVALACGTALSACSAKSADSGNAIKLDELRSSVAYDENPMPADADLASVIAAQNQLGTALLASACAPTDNFVFSPTSATVALSMAYAGARGDTATEMQAALGDTLAVGQYHVAWDRLLLGLTSRNLASHTDAQGVEHHLQLGFADRLWAQKGMTVVPAFLGTLSGNYNVGVALGDFAQDADVVRQTINGWVANHTADRIQSLLSPGALNQDTRFVLVNALYFNGSWATPFETGSTVNAPFHPASGPDLSVPTLNASLYLRYKTTPDYSVADLPYEGRAVSLTVVLPQAGKYAAVRALLGTASLPDVFAGLQDAQVEVSLPKLKYQGGSFSVMAGLQALGMKSAFTPNADFSGITTDQSLHISDVVQQDFLAIDEQGTEAAAATAVVGATVSLAIEAERFTVDHPYFFFLRDQTGLILFAGQINDPS